MVEHVVIMKKTRGRRNLRLDSKRLIEGMQHPISGSSISNLETSRCCWERGLGEWAWGVGCCAVEDGVAGI